MWFVTIEQAIDGLAGLIIRTSDARTLADALAEVKKVTATLSQALAPKFKVTLAKPSLDQENVAASLSQANAQRKISTARIKEKARVQPGQNERDIEATKYGKRSP